MTNLMGKKIVNGIDFRTTAQMVIAELIIKFAGETAKSRLESESRLLKQSRLEIAYRVAGNVLKSLVTRKYQGYVHFPD
jgi:hypothetical protein